VQIWNPDSATLINDFLGHTGPVNALAFSPDASLLASASDDGTVRLWETGSDVSTR
jgi:WD40 repeat protein